MLPFSVLVPLMNAFPYPSSAPYSVATTNVPPVEASYQVIEEYLDNLTDDDIRAAGPDEFGKRFTNGIDEVPSQSIPWPGGDVPYQLSPSVTDDIFTSEFYAAIGDFHGETCIRFRPKGDVDQFFINVFSGDG